jgi:hypothetical protein
MVFLIASNWVTFLNLKLMEIEENAQEEEQQLFFFEKNEGSNFIICCNLKINCNLVMSPVR